MEVRRETVPWMTARHPYTAIFAQRPEKVKARIGDNSGPPRPSRHDGSVVQKVYFLHAASP